MHSDDKRQNYATSYHSSKINKEADYEYRLRIIKEKYEERLEAITEKVKLIYDDIRKDEVISTMRSDPASSAFVSHRMKEICEDRLASEREQTINQLTEELALLQLEFGKSEKEIKSLKENLEAVSENLRNEKAKCLNFEQENKILRNKLSHFSQEFEEVHKKNFENTSEALKTAVFESENLKKQLDSAERTLWQKCAENEILVNEAEENKEKINSLMIEINKKNEELRDKEKAYKDDFETFNELKFELENYRRERDDLKVKQKSYGQQFKDIIETEERSHKEALKEITANYKEKATRFKKKIIEQKKLIVVLENELGLAREVAENNKQGQERLLMIAQEDLKKVKDQ